jgi:membrane protease YdiL (CAAX protease family)
MGQLTKHFIVVKLELLRRGRVNPPAVSLPCLLVGFSLFDNSLFGRVPPGGDPLQNKKESSVFAFFVLVFALSIPFWVLGIIYPIELLPGLPMSAIGAFTPALAALVLTSHYDRLLGVPQLLRRTFDFNRIKGKNWFLVILLVNPAIAVLAYVIIGAVREPLPVPAPLTLAIFPMFAFFFVGALAEELGWSGYATEPLEHRWGTLTASVLLGAVWAIWHFVPLVQAHRTAGWIAWWSVDTIALRMIMTWFYIHSGKSVFAATAFHAMINLSWQLFPINGTFYDPLVFGLITLDFAFVIYAGERFLSPGESQAA